MRLRKAHRIAAALLALGCIAFAQLAIAAHSCGGSMDDSPIALCHAHCQQGSQSLDKPDVPAVPPAALSGFALPAPAPVEFQPRSADLPGLFARTTAPPIAIRNCCFRI